MFRALNGAALHVDGPELYALTMRVSISQADAVEVARAPRVCRAVQLAIRCIHAHGRTHEVSGNHGGGEVAPTLRPDSRNA